MSKVPHEERVLNDEQQRAVQYGTGPLLIIAGAGTGKTTVVTERIKHIIANNLAKPSEILSLTFTEKAAAEMEERVDQILPYGYTQLWIATFHSFCEKILKAEAIHIGLSPNYRLLSDADGTMLMRKHLFSFGLQYFRPLGNPTKFIAGMLQHFSRLKDEDITPEQYRIYVQGKSETRNSKSEESEEEELEQKKYQELSAVYSQYEELKIKEGVMDFADLISNTLSLFRTRPNILAQYRKQFKFILIDEFQDTNVAQYELIKLLAPPDTNPNLTIVGDDNQAIYKFRGAAVSNILSFQQDYPTVQQVVLATNYRSYQFVLDAAYRLIKHNDPDTLEAKLGISKKLVSTRADAGGHVQFIHEDRVENEAESVAKEVKKFVGRSSKKYSYKDIAILVRANNHAESFIRAFTRLGIPFQFLGPGQLFRKDEIKELIAYLQVLINWQDSIAFLKVLSMPYFALAPRDLVLLSNYAKRSMMSLFEVCELIVGIKETQEKLPEVSIETREKLQMIMSILGRHIGLVYTETAGQILYYFLQDSGILGKILNYEFPLDEQKANNITRFFSKLKTYESEHDDATVGAVLDWILLAMELGESPLATDTDWTDNNAVNILTVHSAKGLEFPIVFLVNLVAQRFPTNERREQIPIPEELIKETLPAGDFHLEEERRLFYVGMTRARDHLYFTASNFYGEGKREKKLSPFVTEVLGTDAVAKPTQKTADQLSLLDWNVEKPSAISPQPSAPNIKVTYLSYSQIETFKTCPLHYKLSYILKVPTPPSPALSFGSTMHTVLRRAYEMVRNHETVSETTLMQLLEESWQKEGYSNKEYQGQMKKRGQEYLRGYFAKEFNPKTTVLTLEQSFTIPLTGDGRFLRAGGRIDRVDDLGDGRIEIVDYKTGKMLTKKEVDSNLQLSMYALAATEIPDRPFARKPEEVVLTLYYFDTQEKISTTRTLEQLTQEKQNILAVAAEIEQSNFTCSGNMLCNNCEYKMFCGVNKEWSR